MNKSKHMPQSVESHMSSTEAPAANEHTTLPVIDILGLQGSVRPGRKGFTVEEMNEAVKARAARAFLASRDGVEG